MLNHTQFDTLTNEKLDRFYNAWDKTATLAEGRDFENSHLNECANAAYQNYQRELEAAWEAKAQAKRTKTLSDLDHLSRRDALAILEQQAARSASPVAQQALAELKQLLEARQNRVDAMLSTATHKQTHDVDLARDEALIYDTAQSDGFTAYGGEYEQLHELNW